MNYSRLDPRRTKYYGMFESGTLLMLGMVELIFAFILLIPTAFAIYYDEATYPFTSLIPLLVILGIVQMFLFRQSSSFRSANGLLVIVVAWIFVFALGMVPFMLAGMNPVDALFETVSGFTTTGASILADIESWPKSVLVWRSLTQWVGGIAVIIIFMYVIPFLGVGRSILANELSGSGDNRYTVKLQKAAKSFIFVYSLLSLVHLFILLICGVPVVESFCLVFTTISTGGLMCTNDSLAGFSDLVQVLTIVFMFMGGINFYLHYRFIYYKDPQRNENKKSRSSLVRYKAQDPDLARSLRERCMIYLGNSEFRFNVVWFVGIAIFATIILLMSTGPHDNLFNDILVTFKNVLFTVVSLGTTTGFAVVDYMEWPEVVIIILFFVALFGASAGSTSGGIKLFRLRIAYGFIVNSINRTLRPNGVYSVKTDRNRIEDSVVLSALSVIVMYVVTLVIGAFVVMLYGYGTLDAFGLTVTCVSNGGLGFGSFGPSGSMADLPDSLKVFMSFLMWVGRHEILIALALLTPAFWKEIWHNRRFKSRVKRENKNNRDAEWSRETKTEPTPRLKRINVRRRRR